MICTADSGSLLVGADIRPRCVSLLLCQDHYSVNVEKTQGGIQRPRRAVTNTQPASPECNLPVLDRPMSKMGLCVWAGVIYGANADLWWAERLTEEINRDVEKAVPNEPGDH